MCKLALKDQPSFANTYAQTYILCICTVWLHVRMLEKKRFVVANIYRGPILDFFLFI